MVTMSQPYHGTESILGVVTWGEIQLMSPQFLTKYNDESVVCLSEEMLRNGRSLEAFDLDGLKDRLSRMA